jgi:hypothetical protein
VRKLAGADMAEMLDGGRQIDPSSLRLVRHALDLAARQTACGPSP